MPMMKYAIIVGAAKLREGDTTRFVINFKDSIGEDISIKVDLPELETVFKALVIGPQNVKQEPIHVDGWRRASFDHEQY